MIDDKVLLQAEQVNFEYESDSGPVQVFRGLDFSVHRGELVAVLGHNGSGKSTLAKLFNAILLPSGGTVYVDGMVTASEDILYEIRRRVGMVFQNPDNQIVANVVEEDVAFGPENLGVPSDEIRMRVDKALKLVGMYEFREHAPHRLSGGQKQRVAIAGILAMEPKCIVLDEPTAMLDPVGRAEVMKTILRINRENGVTVVLITHHMEEAAQCGRVVVMNSGEIIADGPPEQVFRQVALLHGAGLASPQTVELCYQLRELGIQVPLDRLDVDACAEAIAGAILGKR